MKRHVKNFVFSVVLLGLFMAISAVGVSAVSETPKLDSQLHYGVEVGDVFIYNTSHSASHTSVVYGASADIEWINESENAVVKYEIVNIEYGDGYTLITYNQSTLTSNLSVSDPNDEQWKDATTIQYTINVTNAYDDIFSVPFAVPTDVSVRNFSEIQYVFDELIERHFSGVLNIGDEHPPQNVTILSVNTTHVVIPYIENFDDYDISDIIIEGAVNDSYIYWFGGFETNGTTSIIINYYPYINQSTMDTVASEGTKISFADLDYDIASIFTITKFSNGTFYGKPYVTMEPNDIIRVYSAPLTYKDFYITNVTNTQFLSTGSFFELSDNATDYIENGTCVYYIRPYGDIQKFVDGIGIEHVFGNNVTISRESYDAVDSVLTDAYIVKEFDGKPILRWKIKSEWVSPSYVNLSVEEAFYTLDEMFSDNDNISIYRELPYRREITRIRDFIETLFFNLTKNETDTYIGDDEFINVANRTMDIWGKVLLGEGVIGDGTYDEDSYLLANLSDSHVIVYYNFSSDAELYAHAEINGNEVTARHTINGYHSHSLIYPLNITTGSSGSSEEESPESPFISWIKENWIPVSVVGGVGGISVGIGVWYRKTYNICKIDPSSKKICRSPIFKVSNK